MEKVKDITKIKDFGIDVEAAGDAEMAINCEWVSRSYYPFTEEVWALRQNAGRV